MRNNVRRKYMFRHELKDGNYIPTVYISSASQMRLLRK